MTYELLGSGFHDVLGLWESHPEDKDELEGVVEWEPVDSVHGALEKGKEGVDDPVGEPLGVIGLAGREQRIERVVCWDGEADSVDEEVGADVEEDKEEVESAEAEDNVDLWHVGLTFEVVQGVIFGELCAICQYVQRRRCRNRAQGQSHHGSSRLRKQLLEHRLLRRVTANNMQSGRGPNVRWEK